ncbi:hypothetical protein N656DRAFT_155903 [Canariomyces notabilis]|uniref:Uncharacterized protein n=1 Tax=Canariomyces notabilis TaxID=2074819 RepID=A0AAN6TBK1_9PEZI|nr:hypothetical protein N656DRAFT_155903 [Canariomyces arenarius]
MRRQGVERRTGGALISLPDRSGTGTVAPARKQVWETVTRPSAVMFAALSPSQNACPGRPASANRKPEKMPRSCVSAVRISGSTAFCSTLPPGTERARVFSNGDAQRRISLRPDPSPPLPHWQSVKPVKAVKPRLPHGRYRTLVVCLMMAVGVHRCYTRCRPGYAVC